MGGDFLFETLVQEEEEIPENINEQVPVEVAFSNDPKKVFHWACHEVYSISPWCDDASRNMCRIENFD
ncbi:hypothetical protein V6Z12_D07G072500 [Gossypium hirsutum]